ncbi:unnamed protein product [Prunus brigantina]
MSVTPQGSTGTCKTGTTMYCRAQSRFAQRIVFRRLKSLCATNFFSSRKSKILSNEVTVMVTFTYT